MLLKIAMYSWFAHLKNVIIHSYVGSPEGNRSVLQDF
jgi:hypothetical protein